MKYIPLLAFVALCALLAVAMLRPKEVATTSPLLGKPFPTITLQGQEINAPLEGRVTMVNLFASWCVPCTIEQPILMKIQAQKIVPIIGIAWKNTPEDVAGWLKKHGSPYTHILLDEKGESSIKLALTGVPETFIVDKKNIIRYHTRASISDDILNSDIIPLVKRLEEE